VTTHRVVLLLDHDWHEWLITHGYEQHLDGEVFRLLSDRVTDETGAGEELNPHEADEVELARLRDEVAALRRALRALLRAAIDGVVPCPDCAGTGGSDLPCPSCGGRGEVGIATLPEDDPDRLHDDPDERVPAPF
jgi:hypothetical protein